MEKGKVARVYSINQEKLDEACQAMADLLLDFASKEKLTHIKMQIDKKLVKS
jgi:hypothetical protein